MKKITIGTKEYELCETAEDLPIKRYTALKEYMNYKFMGIDTPDLNKTLQRMMSNYDNESKSQMIVTIADYLRGVNMVESRLDPDQLAFAVITKAEGEDFMQFDQSKGVEKLEEMNNEGLNQVFLEKEVTSFINASQTHWLSYFRENLMGQKETP